MTKVHHCQRCFVRISPILQFIGQASDTEDIGPPVNQVFAVEIEHLRRRVSEIGIRYALYKRILMELLICKVSFDHSLHVQQAVLALSCRLQHIIGVHVQINQSFIMQNRQSFQHTS